MHVGGVAGTAVVKNSNGITTIGTAADSIRVRSANGDITVDRAESGVEAKTANGSVRVLDAARGTLTLETSLGDIEVGIREGSAAWLDVNTRFGRVVNDMTAATEPGAATDKVEVHAGDVRRRHRRPPFLKGSLMRNPAISATGLRKAYGDKVVLDGIDLHVPAGTVFSLLGPNGAGKTTTVNILSTLVTPDSKHRDRQPAPTSAPTRTVSAPPSASPASSPPSTISSPARRTCSSWRICTICRAGRDASAPPNSWSASNCPTPRRRRRPPSRAACAANSTWR